MKRRIVRRKPKARSPSRVSSRLHDDVLHPRVANLIYQLERDELRLAQSELEQSRAHFADLYDFAPVGYLTLDRNGSIRSANITASKLLGRDRVHLISHPLLPLIAQSDRRTYLRLLSALRRGRHKIEGEVKIERPDHQLIPVQMVSIASGPREGSTVTFRTAIVDLTDRKRAEMELSRHVERVGLLLRASLNVMAATSLSAVLRCAAAAARALSGAEFGMACRDYIDGSFVDEVWSHEPDSTPDPADLARIRENATLCLRSGRSVVPSRAPDAGPSAHTPAPGAPENLVLPDGLLCAGLHGNDGRMHGMIVVQHRPPFPVSTEVQVLLEQMAAITSLALQHIEARTLAEQNAFETRALNATLEARVTQRTSQIRMLALELSSAAEQERRKLAQLLHDHLQQLLVSARMHAEQIQCQSQEEVARKLAGHVLDLIAESIRECKSLVVDLSPPILHEAGLTAALMWLGRWMREKHGLSVAVNAGVDVGPDKDGVAALLFQTVRELLFNVAKHAGVTEARVTVEHSPEGKLRVVVTDEGVGFSPDLIEGGNGSSAFGLFNIRERIRLLGGDVEIRSAPGKGARVTLQVPVPQDRETLLPSPHGETVKSPVSTSVAGASRTARSKKKIRVLLADDHRIMREGLANLLRVEQDMEVVGEAENGLEAVHMTRDLQPQVVIMDLSMPVMSGIEATQSIVREYPCVKVIALSIYEEADRAESVLAAGAIDYVSKAEASTKLISAIRSCMTDRSPHR